MLKVGGWGRTGPNQTKPDQTGPEIEIFRTCLIQLNFPQVNWCHALGAGPTSPDLRPPSPSRDRGPERERRLAKGMGKPQIKSDMPKNKRGGKRTARTRQELVYCILETMLGNDIFFGVHNPVRPTFLYQSASAVKLFGAPPDAG